MKVTLPKNFDTETQKCPMVILMHGIFSSMNITPMPAIAKALEDVRDTRMKFRTITGAQEQRNQEQQPEMRPEPRKNLDVEV